VRILRRLRRRARVAAGIVNLWREDLARVVDGRVSTEGTKRAVKRASTERLRLLGTHGRGH
jgi:hypothetical protein